jgi:hypothetical protein
VDGDRERDQVQRLTLTDAAEVLGISKDAVRMRVRRGTLRSEKGADGRVHVFLDPTANRVHPEPGVEGAETAPSRELVEEMRGRIEDLREQLASEREGHREARRIIAGLVQRVPELEAAPAPPPQQPRGSDLRAEEAPEGSTPGGDRAATEAAGEGPERRPWWRRVFGG